MQCRPLTDKKYWDQYYGEKKNHGKFLQSHGILDRHIKDVLDEYVTRQVKGKKLVEFGCGNSNWLPYFAAKFGFQVSGVDYSEKGIGLAREKLLSCGLSADLHLLDFLSLPGDFSSGFDMAVSFGVVEHFSNPSRILDIFARTLKPGGLLLTMVPKMTGFQGRVRKWSHPASYRCHCALPLSGYVGEHRRAGLEIISAQEIGLSTLGLNMRDRAMLGLLYRVYLKILNKTCQRLVPRRLVQRWGVGSGFLIIAGRD